jgi:peptidoglycan/xylan/chitin deacetylase (PgdA/CDA1 family)
MENRRSSPSRKLARLFCGFTLAALISGCATPAVKTPPPAVVREEPSKTEVAKAEAPKVEPPRVMERTFPEFVAVIAREGDSFSSLSEKYLHDPSFDWLIAEFNELDDLAPGRPLIVPLGPPNKGGLASTGYQTVPVLCYHQFSLGGATKMTVTQAAFEAQMQLLKEKGYRVITLDQLFDFLEFKSQIPRKSVVITIDDGWRNAYDIAYPILKKYGYPWTLFIYTDQIVGSAKTLSWDLIKEMASNGMDPQCHTKTHRNLTVVDKKESFRSYFDALVKEVSDSSALIKKRLDRDVKYLAYPFGETNRLVIEVLKKNGFRGALTVKRGGNPFFIHDFIVNRSMIYGELDLSQFEKNLAIFSEEPLR